MTGSYRKSCGQTSKLFQGVYPTDRQPEPSSFQQLLLWPVPNQVNRMVSTDFHSTFHLRGQETSLIPMAILEAVWIKNLES